MSVDGGGGAGGVGGWPLTESRHARSFSPSIWLLGTLFLDSTRLGER